MKRVISILLAVITLLGVLSGVTFAAEKATVEVKLRSGQTVDAPTPEDFLAAYKAVWEPNSNVNRIRIMANYNLYTDGLRTEGGHDPWMSGYEKQLCIRMPEGTCLDLNGFTIAIRANQGLDDNGTGKASGLNTLGTVIDTFGGGRINLYAITEAKYLQHAFDLAGQYAEFVRSVCVSKAIPGAESYEYTVPAGVCLRFSGKPSHLPAKKVTLQPGCTVEKTVENAPGFEGCKAVVWQYIDEADKERMGSQYATEKVKVEGVTIPLRDNVNYRLITEGGGSAVNFVHRPTYVYTTPGTINAPTDATSDAAVILNPAGVEFLKPRKLTYEEHQKLIQDIAVTYYYQSNEEAHMQYDGRSVSQVSSLSRHSDDGRPEDVGFDTTVYSVCSNYPWKCYRTAYSTDYQLFRMSYARTRTWSDFDPAKTPELVYQYSGPLAKNSKGETDFEKALTESRKAVQAGDILVYTDDTNGHALLFVGDIFGDGKDYILHCMGSSYDTTTGEDKREAPGLCINLIVADESCWGGPDAKWSFYGYNKSAQGFAVLRPWQDPDLPATPTQEAMCRMQFPRMKITRNLDRYMFEGVQAGEEVPVYVTAENKSTQDYVEVPVEEYIPAGTTLVEGSQTVGAKVEGNTIKWAVKIPAGKKITLSYKVKVDGKLGDTIDFKGGLVGGIESRSMALQIGGKPLTNDQMMKINEAGMDYRTKKADFRDLDFFNKFYKDVLGLNIGLPKTADALLEELTESPEGSAVYLKKSSPLRKMIIPLHFTGQYAHATDEWDQVRENKMQYYQPGDIFVTLKGDSTKSVKNAADLELMMYIGDGRVLVHNSKGTSLDVHGKTIGSLLMHNLVIALRPTLAYEDLNTFVPKEMAFTDVTEADWFYEYVKEMFDSGIINGMTETTFAPKGNLTWGQALKLVTLAVGESEQAGGAHWASGYLALAKEKKWLTKDVDLNASITRLDFCKVAAKAKNLTEMPAKNPFTDTTSREVMALYHAGIINGMTETTFAPKDLLTRAQISKIIALLVK